jgi:hypothetical protein
MKYAAQLIAGCHMYTSLAIEGMLKKREWNLPKGLCVYVVTILSLQQLVTRGNQNELTYKDKLLT